MYRFTALILMLALAACTAPPVTGPGPASQARQPVAAVQPSIGTGPAASLRSFREVVSIVEPVAEAECRARAPRSNCDFRILVDDRPGQPPNAFQTLDRSGRPVIAFTVSLIAQVRNQDEIAFVLSHEAAHHIAGHLALQQRNATIGAAVFAELAGVFGNTDVDSVEAAQQLGAALGARSYSKDFELEADRLGTVITARAGFNPLRGAEFFFRIPDPGNQFLGTHPANADRVAVVRQTAAQLGIR